MQPIKKFPNLFTEKLGRKSLIFTKNCYPGLSHFEERIVKKENLEFREFSSLRSKLAAAIAKDISQIGFREESIVLYLGASHGYTPSFVSDIIGEKGTIFAIDIAPRVVRDLYFLSQRRKNIIPLLADCSHPESYQHLITGCDVLYQDISQRDQPGIFLKNMRFLKPGGFGLLAVKARSIDVTKNPREIFKKVKEELEKQTTIVDYRELDPFEKDHCLFVIKKK
ncbi:MAG: fibrillarin-like rRNA/tRNA 2'-O-methyltransferase [Nanoarchaeota archaeon]